MIEGNTEDARQAALRAVSSSPGDVVLDFDHTLFLANSTHEWLDALRPRALAYFTVLCCDAAVAIGARLRLWNADHWRDQARVAVTTLLFPWAYFLWRRTARARMARHLNNPLARAAAAREITVLSYGFRHLIAPLLTHAPFQPRLVASSAFSARGNLRARGKLAALEAAMGEGHVRCAVFVTDSRADQEVLDAAGTPALVQWADYPPPAFQNVYFPMRYAVAGKYAGRKYFTTQILQEDLAIWLLAYAWSPGSLPVLLLAFLAMYCVYEIGYWENDHRAAKREASPSLSGAHARFAEYPIAMALPWAVVLSAGALFLADASLGVSMIWTGVLAGLFTAFRLFNRLPVHRRPWVFPLLHGFKGFAGAVFLPLTPLGVALLASQWLSQIVLYVTHRSGGNPAAMNRQAHRGAYFTLFALLAVLFVPGGGWATLSGSDMTDNTGFWSFPVLFAFPGLQITLILAWLAFRALQRAYGRRIIAILARALRR